MTPTPIYTANNLSRPAFHLRYTWSGWPSTGVFPSPPSAEIQQTLEAAWESDGLRKLEGRWKPELIQYTFSVTPTVDPVYFARHVKGRLQYALRLARTPTTFSRKLAVRTIGDNHTAEVEAYIQQQVDREQFADERFKELLRQFTVVNPEVDLTQPTETNSGRYWYNLHLVLVVEQRYRIAEERILRTIRDTCFKIAAKKEHGISVLSVMPDHLHMALRGNINHSPKEIALAFLNNLAYALGQRPMWEFGYYAGTFGEYDMQSVRTS